MLTTTPSTLTWRHQYHHGQHNMDASTTYNMGMKTHKKSTSKNDQHTTDLVERLNHALIPLCGIRYHGNQHHHLAYTTNIKNISMRNIYAIDMNARSTHTHPKGSASML